MKIDMRDAFFNKLVEKAKLDLNIIILSADHGAFALEDFAIKYPNQYINIGISEQNMVGVAAGLAASGKVVFIYGISPFVSLRVLEQLTIDIAAMNLPVNVISVGAGFTYSTDGQTHLGLQDMAVIMTIPGISIFNSSDPTNTSDFIDICLKEKKPHYIRIEKEKLSSFDRKNSDYLIDGFSLIHSGSSNLLVITTGAISHDVSKVIQKLCRAKDNYPTHIDIHKIKPINEIQLIKLLNKFKNLISVEENYQGGLESIISRICLKIGWQGEFYPIYVPEIQIFVGTSRESLRKLTGLDNARIEAIVSSRLEESNKR